MKNETKKFGSKNNIFKDFTCEILNNFFKVLINRFLYSNTYLKSDEQNLLPYKIKKVFMY